MGYSSHTSSLLYVSESSLLETRFMGLCPQGFNLKQLKHLVLDEADKLLDMDFEQEIDQILKVMGSVDRVGDAALSHPLARCPRFLSVSCSTGPPS